MQIVTQAKEQKWEQEEAGVHFAAPTSPAAAGGAVGRTGVGTVGTSRDPFPASTASAAAVVPAAAVISGAVSVPASAMIPVSAAVHAAPVPAAAAAGGGGGGVRQPLNVWSFLDQVQAQAQSWQQQQAAMDYDSGSAGTAAAAGVYDRPLAAEARPCRVAAAAGGSSAGGRSSSSCDANSSSVASGGVEDGSGTSGTAINAPCVLCGCEPRGVLLLPCKHYVLCPGCSELVEGRSLGACPACREPVAGHLVVHRS